MAREYPRSPQVGVGCVLVRRGEVLLVKRKYPPGRGKWSVPGGHVELGEDLLETAVRELEEETGLRAKAVGVINVDTLIVRDLEGRIKYHYVLVDVLMKEPKGELRPSEEVAEARFFPLGEVLQLDLTRSSRGLLEKLSKGGLPIESPLPQDKYEYVEG
ncbi:MAG: NUDIX hydrolase [Acidilobaceae archaeon]|nr:NUDIX hydrolase [Acidilobaceae archaeon]MCX8165047.1 NUDIX hydrolase [Acidilobaceae archaeon]MDW7974436.1 NUDIX hydrolase [Sulfolobales archaeon]